MKLSFNTVIGETLIIKYYVEQYCDNKRIAVSIQDNLEDCMNLKAILESNGVDCKIIKSTNTIVNEYI